MKCDLNNIEYYITVDKKTYEFQAKLLEDLQNNFKQLKDDISQDSKYIILYNKYDIIRCLGERFMGNGLDFPAEMKAETFEEFANNLSELLDSRIKVFKEEYARLKGLQSRPWYKKVFTKIK